MCGRPWIGGRLPRLDGLAGPHARTTGRLADLHRRLGFALGGEPGSRLAGALAVPTSGDTLLRRVTGVTAEPEPVYRYVGIDDFALRKGHTYGTILIDLERGRVIDLLGGRDGAAVEAWLKAHPGVEVVTRDRWSAYASAASAGAPAATQVADRWHLLRNLREAVERLFERSAGAVRTALAGTEPVPVATTPPVPPPDVPAPIEPGSTPDPAPEAAAIGGRRQREENHRRVRDLGQQGWSSRRIARHLRLCRNVVRRYLRTEQYTDGRATRPRRTRLDGFTGYVDQRVRDGCRSAVELHRELAARGCRSSRCTVRRFLARRLAAAGVQRPRAAAPAPRPPRSPSARRLSYEFVRRPADRPAAGRERLDRLRACGGGLGAGLALAEEFAGMVRGGCLTPLPDWLGRVAGCDCPEVRAFADGLRQDEAAVTAALTTAWSNGPVEGQVNRLKVIKRQMYGRAGLPLLRARVRHNP